MRERGAHRGSRAPIRLMALALALALGVSGVALAAYGGQVTMVAKTKVASPTSLRSANARCDYGEESVSGGFQVSGQAASSARAISFKRVSRRGWRTRIDNDGAQTVRLTSYAYCRQRHPRTPVVAGRTSIRPQDTGEATATCPEGTTAVSGGFAAAHYTRASDGAKIRVVASERASDASWSVTGINASDSFQGRMVAYAYCGPGTLDMVVGSAHRNVSPGAVQTVDAQCPPGNTAVSGGFESGVSHPVTGFEGNTPITSKRAGAKAWENVVVNPGSAPHPITSFVYCAA